MNGMSAAMVEVTQDNLQDVLQESLNRPVLIDFYADWCEPCKQLAPVLESIAQSYAGKFLLAKINADDHRLVATQMGVRSLPSLKLVFQGQIVAELAGAQPATVIRKMLDQLLSQLPERGDRPDETAMFLEQVDHAVEAGMVSEALAALHQNRDMAQSDQDRHPFTLKLAQIYVKQGQIAEAKSLLAELPNDFKGRSGLEAQLAFMSDLDQLLPVDELLKRLIVDEKDVEAHYQLGIHAVGTQNFDGALESFLEVMRIDRQFRGDAGRLSLIRLFDILGEDPRVPVYRRKMFNLLH